MKDDVNIIILCYDDKNNHELLDHEVYFCSSTILCVCVCLLLRDHKINNINAINLDSGVCAILLL